MKPEINPIVDRVSRRTVMKTTAITGVLAGLGLGGLAASTSQKQHSTIKLGGRAVGWIGRAPESIEGETNPTLEFQAGETYEVVWTNLDGAEHDFVIQDADGTILVNTEFESAQGGRQRVTFTASNEMAEYYCTNHPISMRGKVTVSGDAPAEAKMGDRPPEGPEQTILLGGRKTGWIGRAPESIAGKRNPTLRLQPGKAYRVVWMNLDGADHNFMIHTADEKILVRTNIMGNQGATQRVTFTAKKAMHEYHCQVHPGLMAGEVVVGDAKETPTETPPKMTEPTETFKLGFKDGKWIGQAPATINGQTNPTLQIEASNVYAIKWTNLESIADPANRPNLVITEAYPGGKAIVRSNYLKTEGATQTVTFTATNTLSAYFAQNYLHAKGDIKVV
jgi:plastocyanin